MITKIIKEYVEKYDNNITLELLLNDLFLNWELIKYYTSPIRRATIIWNIANEILSELKIDSKCRVLAIGDIKYFWDLKNKWKNLVFKSLNEINIDLLEWYDLSWIWTDLLRENLFNYSKVYYWFPENIQQEVLSSITPTYWSSDGFFMILDTLKKDYKNSDFYYPEASFLINVEMAKDHNFNTISLNKPSIDDYFISKEQIDNIYSNWKRWNVFYFTTVWNPTWEKINNLKEIISYIVNYDYKSIIILDNVYVWILKNQVSKDIFKEIFNDNKILNNLIFSESLSKTLWTTWIRIGWVWSLNKELNNKIRLNIISKKAWFSKLIDSFWVNLLSKLDEVINFQDHAYMHFSEQRIKFLNFLKQNYIKYYDFDISPKVIDREGIYLLIKIKHWYSFNEIFSKTWAIWVWVTLSDWNYIRYAFWNVSY